MHQAEKVATKSARDMIGQIPIPTPILTKAFTKIGKIARGGGTMFKQFATRARQYDQIRIIFCRGSKPVVFEMIQKYISYLMPNTQRPMLLSSEC